VEAVLKSSVKIAVLYLQEELEQVIVQAVIIQQLLVVEIPQVDVMEQP
jgi:hypothetical protein